MTISSTTRVAGPFTGAGSTATFPFTFKVFLETDLEVVVLNEATNGITTLALTTDYTAALNADQDSSPGGSITLTAGNLATGYTLTITTDIAQLQGLDLTNGGGFYPDVINAALDLLTILVQQLGVQALRSLQVPLVDASPSMTLPPAAERAGKVLMFDSSGNLLLAPMAPGSGLPATQAAPEAADGLNKVFTFTASADAAPVPMIFAAGVYQTLTEDYSAPINTGGTTWQFTFATAPANGPITVLLLA